MRRLENGFDFAETKPGYLGEFGTAVINRRRVHGA
jgi:hypothetical protein